MCEFSMESLSARINKTLEKVKMRASKLVIAVKHLPYRERLVQLKLPTLKYRRARGDMIEVYKILNNKYKSLVNLYLEQLQITRTTDRDLELVNHRCHYDLRKYSFTVQVINAWNSLPELVILADTVDTFKNRLGKFWKNQDMVYDYKSDLIGIGNRSLTNIDELLTYCT